MLDIKDELKNYKFIELGNAREDKAEGYENLSRLLTEFTRTYERIGKEQYKTTNGIGETLDLIEEINEGNKENQCIIKEFREKEKSKENDIKALVNSLVSIVDIFDYINEFAIKSGNENLKNQFGLVTGQMMEKLAQGSIMILGSEDGSFDINLHNAVGTDWNKDKPEGIILQVVRKGYIYKGKILRKAEIIVNKINENERN